MTTEALSASEALSAKGATAPRVAVPAIEERMTSVVYLNLGDAIECGGQDPTPPTYLMTLCAVTMRNGFVVIGKSAPASADNFDQEKGRIFAYEDAVKQIWPMEGYLLRERLSTTGTA